MSQWSTGYRQGRKRNEYTIAHPIVPELGSHQQTYRACISAVPTNLALNVADWIVYACRRLEACIGSNDSGQVNPTLECDSRDSCIRTSTNIYHATVGRLRCSLWATARTTSRHVSRRLIYTYLTKLTNPTSLRIRIRITNNHRWYFAQNRT